MVPIQDVAFSELSTADLCVDAIYRSGRSGNAGDDPFPSLLGMSNQGGFRYRSDAAGDLQMLLLTTNMGDPDWPDALDPETGIFTYYGDNKQPGRTLLDTGRRGNRILQRIFEAAHGGIDGRAKVPPIFLFAKASSWSRSSAASYRDMAFLGLAVPGAAELLPGEDLVAIWRSVEGQRFQNYRARFTVLDAPSISRSWISSLISGSPDDSAAPPAWLAWRDSALFSALRAQRSIEYRSRSEQMALDASGEAMIAAIRSHFRPNPHQFEHCAAAIARLMIPGISTIDVTRPSRDGGRDAIGHLQIGTGPGSILVDFALEAKCYSPPTAVGVRDMSRLISRLRHRQFGILVTTTCVDLQAYKEIKEDQHPIVIISATDIVRLLRSAGRGNAVEVIAWLQAEFPSVP